MVVENCEAVLIESASEVLETMYFSSVFGLANAEGLPDEPWLSAQLAFRRHSAGTFGLDVPMNTARTLAANFLACDEDEVSDTQCAQVVCELANIICGATLLRLGSNSRFDLSHPEVQRNNYREECRDATTRVTLQLDNSILEIWLKPEKS
jgi:hypothetical protein